MWEELHVKNILRKGNDFSHYTPAHPPHWSFMFLRRKNKNLTHWKFEQRHKNFLRMDSLLDSGHLDTYIL